MRGVNTRDIEQANKCMLMAAIAYNLKKLLKFTTRKVQTNLEAIQVSLQALFLPKTSFYKPICFYLGTLCLNQNSNCNYNELALKKSLMELDSFAKGSCATGTTVGCLLFTISHFHLFIII